MKTTPSSEDGGRYYAGTVPSAIIDLLTTRTRDTSVKNFLPVAPVSRPAHSQSVAPHSRNLPSSNQEVIPVVPDHLQVLPWIGSQQSCPPSRARYRNLRAQQIRRISFETVPTGMHRDISVRSRTQHEGDQEPPPRVPSSSKLSTTSRWSVRDEPGEDTNSPLDMGNC